MQAQLAAVRHRVDPVRVEAALDRAAALLEALGQIAPHQPEPGAVDLNLVVGIHRRDRVLQVHDGGDGRFHHQIGDAGRILGADRVRAVDPDVEMQVVVAQEHGGRARRIALVADEAAPDR